MPIPEAIQSAPVLYEGLDLFLTAFLDLSTCRGVTMAGAAPIPWTAIDRYCVAHNTDGELREDIFYHVRQLDEWFMTPRKDKE